MEQLLGRQMAAIVTSINEKRYPELCRHCHQYQDEHAEGGKCLFEPSTFDPYPNAEALQTANTASERLRKLNELIEEVEAPSPPTPIHWPTTKGSTGRGT
jgi:hypothetical protein